MHDILFLKALKNVPRTRCVKQVSLELILLFDNRLFSSSFHFPFSLSVTRPIREIPLIIETNLENIEDHLRFINNNKQIIIKKFSINRILEDRNVYPSKEYYI